MAVQTLLRLTRTSWVRLAASGSAAVAVVVLAAGGLYAVSDRGSADAWTQVCRPERIDADVATARKALTEIEGVRSDNIDDARCGTTDSNGQPVRISGAATIITSTSKCSDFTSLRVGHYSDKHTRTILATEPAVVTCIERGGSVMLTSYAETDRFPS